MIEFENVRAIEKPSFFDFLKQGWSLNLKCAIDFTASNGEISQPDSLHFIDPSGRLLNAYESAILQVGSILDHYSSDKMYNAVGFGGKPLNKAS
jgi:hypothetical protein